MKYLRILAVVGLLLAVANAADPYGLATRPSFVAYNNGKLPPDAAAVAGTWSTEVAYPNLTFLNPLGILPLPGTSKLVVWGREGYVWSFDDTPTVATKKLILDLHTVCQGWDDQGLLGLAFHPKFATNHYVYLWYNRVLAGDKVDGDMNTRPNWKKQLNRLSRFTYKTTTGTLDPASEYVLIDQTEYSPWHNGGGIFFHPDDGFLYLTNGNDANGGNDQRIDGGLFGGVLRLDVDKRGGSISHAPTQRASEEVGVNWPNGYFIPNDNPFIGVPGALEEFFALGLRSPHRMTIDPVSKRIFIGDVGDGSREEIDTIEPGETGLNFQYSSIEGYNGDLTPPYTGVNKRPIIDYEHGGDGSAVIGGYVYRGTAFPELAGKYIFGDNGSNNLWMLDESTHTATTPAAKIALTTLPKGAGPNSGNDYTGLSSFGFDANGELLLCQLSSLGGKIYKLSRTGPPARQMPLKLSDTGVFSSLADLAPATGLVSYDVNTPLWSDGAHKQRWLGVPDGKKIGFTATGEWTFPDGTVFVKHFELPNDDRDPTKVQRLETRVLVRDDLGYVYGGSYQWRADQSDADLVIDAKTEDVTITNADASTRQQPWFYPGRQDCTVCHNRASSGVLGVNAQQSNRAHLFPQTGNTDNQLRAWSHAGYFTTALDENAIPALVKLAALDDANASFELRARSYLDANCSHCHRPGGVPAFWDARLETPLDDAGIVNGLVNNTLGLADAHVITPGNVANSVLHRRLSTATEVFKMPPIAKNVVDQAAVNVIAQWIAVVTAPPPKPLPIPWANVDVGNVGQPGSATARGSVFTLQASGDDIWGGADAFHFAHHALTGDGSLVARVLTVSATDGWTKAGVMIRATLDASSPHAMTVVTPGNGVAFQRRVNFNGESSNDQTGGGAPWWVKIERSGAVCISSESSDGANWNEVGRETIAMGKTVEIGLGLTAHNNGALAVASFDNITFTGTGPLAKAPPAAIVSGPFSWKLGDGVTAVSGLPAGLKFDARTGSVRGTPNASGTFTVTISARTAQGTVRQKFTLTVQPFPAALTGGFGGLVERSASVNGDLGGRVTFKITGTGVLTGQLFHGAVARAFPLKTRVAAGTSGDPTITLTLPRSGTPPLALALTLDRNDATVSGTVSKGANSAAVHGRHFLADPSALVAAYNTRLSSTGNDLGDASKPQGAGWVRATVSKTGAVAISGSLGDGEPISLGANVLDDLSVPIFRALYSGHGSIIGSPVFADGAPLSAHQLSGTLDWRKFAPGSADDRGYGSFTLVPDVLGRDYHALPPGTLFLGLNDTPANARIDFTEGGIATAAQGAAASQTFQLNATHKARFAPDAVTNPDATTLTIDPRTGLFTGTFRLIDGTVVRKVDYSGIFVPGETKATGWFTLPQLPLPATSPIFSGHVELHGN